MLCVIFWDKEIRNMACVQVIWVTESYLVQALDEIGVVLVFLEVEYLLIINVKRHRHLLEPELCLPVFNYISVKCSHRRFYEVREQLLCFSVGGLAQPPLLERNLKHAVALFQVQRQDLSLFLSWNFEELRHQFFRGLILVDSGFELQFS